MAFSYTRNIADKEGGTKFVTGTYTNTGGSTGGAVVTGLKHIYSVSLQPLGSSVSANQPVVNASLTTISTGKKAIVGGSMTIVTSANEVGTWMAVGL